jgi:hypothetical protein
MIQIGVVVGIAALVFSLYRLLLANDAITLALSVLRVLMVLMGIVALHFNDSIVLTTVVALYAIIAIFVMAIIRNEVQIKHD